jgi:uncharacterized protein
LKIDTRQIPDGGLILTEEFDPQSLDLDTDLIKLKSPVKARAVVSISYDAVDVDLTLAADLSLSCSRCLKDIKFGFNRTVDLNYAADKLNPIINLDADIREEIILSYPVKPLCKENCKGLCPKCGGNLNEGGCNCGTT